jgi:ribosomal protein S27E
MNDEELNQVIDTAFMEGLIDVECLKCGITIQCEFDATTVWCVYCGQVVEVKNILIELGLI